MKYLAYYEPESKIKKSKSGKIITVIFIIILLVTLSLIPITYHIFEDNVIPALIGICIFTLLFLMFVYNLNKNDDWYKTTAFSFENGKGLYIYDLNHIKFLSVCNISKFKVNKSYSRFLIMHIVSKLEERDELKRLLKIIKLNNCLEYVLSNNLEALAGTRIRRILNIRKYQIYTSVVYTYLTDNNNKPERKMTINIYNNINDYEEVIDFFKKYMDKTKYICAKCGSVMQDGCCPNCLGTEIKKEKGISRKTAYIIMAILSILLMGTITVFVLALFDYISVIVMPICFLLFLTLVASMYTLFDYRLMFK